jgi:hypothetical protein
MESRSFRVQGAGFGIAGNEVSMAQIFSSQTPSVASTSCSRT